MKKSFVNAFLQKRILLFFLIITAVFLSLLFNVKSFELFGLSYKTIPFVVTTFVGVIHLSKLYSIRISGFAVILFLFLIYTLFVTVWGYYLPDGMFLLFFLFVCFILLVIIENMKFKRKQFLDALFLISYLDAVFSSFEYIVKTSGWNKIVVIPDSLYITTTSSVGGLLYQPNLNALMLNIGFVIIAFKILEYRGKSSGIVKLFVLLLFFAINSAFTASRAGMLAISVIFMMILLLSHYTKIVKYRRYRLFVIIFLYFFVMIVLNNSPVAKFSHQGFAADSSIDERLLIWTASIMLWLSHPIFGTGLETFKFLNNPYQLPAANLLHIPSNEIGNFIWAHSELIQILVELGAIGLLVVLSLIFRYYTSIIKSVKTVDKWIIPSIVMLFLVQSSLSWPMRHPSLLAIFFITIALIRRKMLFTLKNRSKNVFVLSILIIYMSGFITILPSMLTDFSYNISKPKNVVKKIEKLWLLSKDPFLFWMASGEFLRIASVRYMKITSGIGYLPVKKEDVKAKPQKGSKNEAKLLRKRILLEAQKVAKLHKIWITEYYLGLAYLFNGKLTQAKKHAKRGIAMNPNANSLWVLVHFINVKRASLKTGRPIKDFLPSKSDIKLLRDSMKHMASSLRSMQTK